MTSVTSSSSSSSQTQTGRSNRRIGSSCHQCKHTKTDDQVVSCTAIHGGCPCHIKICDRCLHFRYGLEKNLIALLDDWHCPRCRGVCNCAACMVKQGKKPIKTNCRKRKPQNSDHEFEISRGKRFDGLNLLPEELQEVLRFQRFCSSFGEALNLDRGLVDSIVRDQHALARVCIQLMAIIKQDNGIYAIRHFSKPWLSVSEAADIPYDWEVRGLAGIVELTRCQRLKILNIWCDQALYIWTNEVRASRSARPPTVG